MPKIDTTEAQDYIRRHHREQTIKEMRLATGRSNQFVWRFCIQNNLVPKRAMHGRPGGRNCPDLPPRRKWERWPKDPKPKIMRPPAQYTNSPSPYGIADELHKASISKSK